MKLANIIKQVLATKTLTSDLNQEIDRVLWANLDQEDLAYLAQLVFLIESGSVRLE